MNDVVNQFYLDDFGCALAELQDDYPAKRLAGKLRELTRDVPCDQTDELGRCVQAEIVQLKDGSFWLRWKSGEASNSAFVPSKPITRQQAFALLVVNCFVLGSSGDDAHSEFATEKGAFLDTLAVWE
jgi:hypothetical protein